LWAEIPGFGARVAGVQAGAQGMTMTLRADPPLPATQSR
jgi:hypothetical protein